MIQRAKPIYLDSMATTPVDPQVIEAMLPYLCDIPGNPSSRGHAYGWEAESGVKWARNLIAETLNTEPRNIIWTSGATEANNLAIKGVAESYLQKGRHLITVATEHNAVLAPCQYLETLGFEVTYLSVDHAGLLNLEELEAALRSDTVLVSVMAANNETGVLQPIAEIGELCEQHNVLFHVDAAQAIAKIPIDVAAMKIDMLSITAHKIYGPKGIGALYFNKRKVRLAPQLHGGKQEQGIRSGTLATHQIIGLAKAIEIAMGQQDSQSKTLRSLREQLWKALQVIAGIYLNGHPEKRLPHCLNVSFEDIDGAALLLGVQPTIAVSSGSACSSGSQAPSHVLTAMGRSASLAKATLRFGLGRMTTEADIQTASETVIDVVNALRQR